MPAVIACAACFVLRLAVGTGAGVAEKRAPVPVRMEAAQGLPVQQRGAHFCSPRRQGRQGGRARCGVIW